VDDRQELGQQAAVGVADLLLELLGGAPLVIEKVGLRALRKIQVGLGLAALLVGLRAGLFELGLERQRPIRLGADVSLWAAWVFCIAHRHLRYRAPARGYR